MQIDYYFVYFPDNNTARVVHIGGDIVPVIAAVQTNNELGKHVGLWTLNL